jgi:hypothetical protein
MWEKVGIIRDAAGLDSAVARLHTIDEELGLARAFGFEPHLQSFLARLDEPEKPGCDKPRHRTGCAWRARIRAARISARISRRAARSRHRRSRARGLRARALEISMKPVAFTRVKPGESLLREAAYALLVDRVQGNAHRDRIARGSATAARAPARCWSACAPPA